MDDVINMFTEDSEINYLKTWLCGGSGGQTYPIHDKIFDINVDEIMRRGFAYDFCDIEMQFDNALGFKHDYKVDDKELDSVANDILNRLHSLSKDINENPSKYFKHIEATDLETYCLDNLGVKPSYIVDIICDRNVTTSVISTDYIRGIAEKCIDYIVHDIVACCDKDDWNGDDVAMSFGRALSDKLGIEIN